MLGGHSSRRIRMNRRICLSSTASSRLPESETCAMPPSRHAPTILIPSVRVPASSFFKIEKKPKQKKILSERCQLRNLYYTIRNKIILAKTIYLE